MEKKSPILRDWRPVLIFPTWPTSKPDPSRLQTHKKEFLKHTYTNTHTKYGIHSNATYKLSSMITNHLRISLE
jgi:hypothetical protein